MIKQLREREGLTQAQLAKKAGVRLDDRERREEESIAANSQEAGARPRRAGGRLLE
jgi:transcriptional regulator with XRE-family HTH domain